MKRSVVHRPTAATGRLIRNIQCQEAYCTNQPPSVGPTSGPIRPGMATKLIASRNFSRGKARSTVRRPTGSSMAPPVPCRMRAPVSSVSVRDSAQAPEPRANSTMASMKTRRVPNRSASQPVAGITVAIASAYDTTTACMRSGLSPRPRAIAGKAVLTMVASSVCMKKPMATSHSSSREEGALVSVFMRQKRRMARGHDSGAPRCTHGCPGAAVTPARVFPRFGAVRPAVPGQRHAPRFVN